MNAISALIQKAHAAGVAAGHAANPRPMIVGSPSTPFGTDVDPNQRTYFVADGVCGFAWVHLPVARGPLVAELKRLGAGHKNYRRGYDVWVRGFGQSMQRKEAYARAYAGVLNEAGHDAYADSRMD